MTAGRGIGWKWWMCGALLLATMLNYMDRQTLSLTATQLKAEITLQDDRYGAIEEWFSYAFAAGGIVFGFAADRLGPRRLYPAILIGWSLAGVAAPLASWPALTGLLGDPGTGLSAALRWLGGREWGGFLVRPLVDDGRPGLGECRWLFVCRTTLAFFEAGHWPCALITARNILSDSERPLGNSILQSGASLGAVLTPLAIQGIRATGLPWQAPFLIIGTAGLMWVPLWFWLIRRGDLRYTPPEAKAGPGDPTPALRPVTQFAVLATIVTTIALAWQFQRAWLPKYLKEYHGYPESTANYFTSGYYIVADLGCLFFGGVVSFLTARRVPVRWARLASFSGCCALVGLSAAVPLMDRGPWLLLSLVLVGAGALGAHPQYYALAQELPTRHMGVLSGVLAACSWVAVGRMQGAMGDYIKRTGSYDLPLVVTGLAPLAGLLAMAVWVALSQPKGDPAKDQLSSDYAE